MKPPNKRELIETIARAIHEEYVQQQKKSGQTPQTNPSMVGWEELPEHLKESNWQHAEHIGIKLKAIGCKIVQLVDKKAELFRFTPEEIERLARIEHERWVEERKKSGWKYGATKDIQKKISPYVVSYDQITEDIKELDRNAVRNIPAVLARAGFQIKRLKTDS